ncbi:preprotein translocase subunit YajC [Candidatus Poribacteria bacterium]|nr:preprotein translocase subunit YajC [Candidatus Poribacteria bacterium]MBF75362.1 preprotein translocase subunit YajC [Candidatus Poribacteria bacterium]MCH2574493.1 preprotein translocase subunit YajC [Candidatus Poribacteria bacterium]OUT63839.1 MAG: preprotein translocase subunit YajC [bacterium TMED15]|tara:strand:- start:2388 stop:2675 length:288 start_codon:yes stop_codon:yes gene_type:complete
MEPTMLVQFVPFIAIFLIMYLLIIRPESVKRKKHQQMLENLSKGDEVVTQGGVHGRISSANEKSIMLIISEGVKIEVSRSAIAFLKKGGELIEGE